MGDYPLENIIDFFKEVSPFNSLDRDTLLRIVARTQISFFPRGELIMRMGSKPSGYLYIIQTGAARVSITEESGAELLVDLRGSGDIFGAISLLQGKRAQFNVTAEEDLIVFLIPEKVLLPLLDTQPTFKRFFEASLARNFQAVRKTADDQISLFTPANQLNLEMFLTGKRVEALMTADVLTCLSGTTAQEVAEKMTARRVRSIVVVDEHGTPSGILTDVDLRSKILAEIRSFQTAVGEIMSAPLHTISPQAFAFDALLQMSRHGIGHLVVVEDGRLVGIVSEHDFQIEIGSSPIGVIGDIDKAKTIKKLVGLRPKIDNILEMAMRRSETVRPMVALVAELNDRVTGQLTRLIERELSAEGHGIAPVPYCWLAMGSEGRREQTLYTDQDNALLYRNIPYTQSPEGVQQWFLRFSQRVVDALVKFGIPRCEAGLMASNPQWCQQAGGWEDTFQRWIANPTALHLKMATVFFDFRTIAAGMPETDRLRRLLNNMTTRNGSFLKLLAKNALRNRPPLGFLRQFVVEKTGQHKNELNLKRNGLAPVVDAARVMALELGIGATNTVDRLAEISEHNVIDQEFFSEITEAYDFINFIRITHHLKSRSRGHYMHNFLDPAILNHIQKKMLKESFSIISRLQESLTARYEVH